MQTQPHHKAPNPKIFGNRHSIAAEYMRQLRDVNLHQDRLLFESNIERLGAIAGYEISKELAYLPSKTDTPFGPANTKQLTDNPVIVAVLRAGLPLQRGLQSVLAASELGFVAARRTDQREADGFRIEISYLATPPLTGKTLIIADTMIATGHTITAVYYSLIKAAGKPKHTFIAGIIASQTALQTLTQKLPNASLYISQVDPELNQDFFIVPGLGDAGDILYGVKV